MNKYLPTIVIAIVVFAGLMFILTRPVTRFSPAPTAPEGQACTMEAMMCPDGSYVGRSGPNCEFAACPNTPSATETSTTVTTKLNQGASALDVTVTPTALVEDSRCPVNVNCIQAGTVRVQTTLVSGLGTANETFTLDQPITTEAETVTLIEVRPIPTTNPIAPGDYTFIFRVEKR